MHPAIRDTAGLGIFFWIIGYLASFVLYFTPLSSVMGWVLLVIFTPLTTGIAWWWFRQRERLPLRYYAGVGVAWMLIAVVLDFFFIVKFFGTVTYYAPDVFLYYALMFLVPVGVGLYLNRAAQAAPSG